MKRWANVSYACNGIILLKGIVDRAYLKEHILEIYINLERTLEEAERVI